VDRVGGTESIPVDVRVIATTNRDLMESVNQGDFREDLYFRLNVIPLHLPPLRERKVDVQLLANYFIEKHSEINSLEPPKVHEDVYKLLENYNWRGNVRELENVMERALLLCDQKSILVANLLMTPKAITQPQHAQPKQDARPTSPAAPSSGAEGLKIEVGMTLGEIEKLVILKTLEQTEQNKTKTAEVLGISIRTLRNKLNEYKVQD